MHSQAYKRIYGVTEKKEENLRAIWICFITNSNYHIIIASHCFSTPHRSNDLLYIKSCYFIYQASERWIKLMNYSLFAIHISTHHLPSTGDSIVLFVAMNIQPSTNLACRN